MGPDVTDVGLHDLLSQLAGGDDDLREAAAVALGRLGPKAIEPLSALLRSGDVALRWWAARSLAEVGGQAAIAPLTQALADDDADVRACACLALGRIGAVSAAGALAGRMGDASGLVAAIAADALSMLGAGAVDSLAHMLLHHRPTVRLLAVRALGRTRSQQAVEPLCRALDDTSYLVSQCALDALEKLGVGMVYFPPA